MRLAVTTETLAGERRVALVPDVVKRLRAAGWEVSVQSGAGAGASFPDRSYEEAGAEVAESAASTLHEAEVVVRVHPPAPAEAALVPEGALVIGFLQPAQSVESLRALAHRGASYLSFDRVPRISRAQGMDALSSQSTASGYWAALVAATRLGRFFPMLVTAAGTVPPARVLVLGAGVAGLQAIATSRRLGAVVRGYDVRTASKEEVESLGATFVDLGVVAEGSGGYARQLSDEEVARQQAALATQVAASDAVIATAAVPGRRAPVLVTAAAVDAMAPGTVVVDMAADSGGNCEVTEAGAVVVRNGTEVVGLSNPASSMAVHASLLYSRNVQNLLELVVRDGHVAPDWEDEIIGSCAVLRHGRPADPAVAELLGGSDGPPVGAAGACGETPAP